MYAENGDWLAVTGAEKELDQAVSAYLAGQGSWAAVEDAAEALADTYANVVLQVDGTNEGLYVSYVQGEETAHSSPTRRQSPRQTWTMPIIRRNSSQTHNNDLADASPRPTTSSWTICKRLTTTTWLRTRSNWRRRSTATSTFATTPTRWPTRSTMTRRPWPTRTTTTQSSTAEEFAAEPTPCGTDAGRRGGRRRNGAENADAAADQVQADAEAHSAVTYDDALAAAGTAYATAADAAGAALMDDTVQAEEQYIDQYAQDMVNSAPSGDAAAAAYAAYYTALGSDWAAQARRRRLGLADRRPAACDSQAQNQIRPTLRPSKGWSTRWSRRRWAWCPG